MKMINAEGYFFISFNFIIIIYLFKIIFVCDLRYSLTPAITPPPPQKHSINQNQIKSMLPSQCLNLNTRWCSHTPLRHDTYL